MNQPCGDPRWPFGVTDPGTYEDAIRKLVKEHALAVDGLTEVQLAECIRQAIMCGDFVRYVARTYTPERDNPNANPTTTQCMVYIPFRESEQLKARIKELEDEKESLQDEFNF